MLINVGGAELINIAREAANMEIGFICVSSV